MADAGRLRRLAGDRQHLRRGVDPDHGDPGRDDWNRDPTCPDGELDHGPAGGERPLDVEAHVLRD